MNIADKTTIRGIVIPTAWDSEGAVTAVAVATYEEESFAVADNDNGRKLKTLLHEKVVVTGTVSRAGGCRVIEALDFRLDMGQTPDPRGKTGTTRAVPQPPSKNPTPLSSSSF